MPANLEPGSTLGSYRIDKLLGKGGMGEVYLAQDLRLKREVALKVLPSEVSKNPSYLQRFRREAESAASLHHPNICTIYEIGDADDRTYITMEYCEGTTLQERMAYEPFDVDEVLDIGIQIADSLEEARKKNIVHRDIKSANILLSHRNQVKVLDFGLAKRLVESDQDVSEASTAPKLTESGVVIGTVAYMSPEQALGKPVDHRTDLFSFGVVLYEMLTGRLPFSGNSAPEFLDAILHKQPPSVARYNEKVPDTLIRIINKMLEKDPKERYQSAHEVWTDLRHLKRDSTSVVVKRGLKATSLRYTAFGLGIAITVIVASVIFMRPTKEPHRPNTLSEISSLVALPAKVYGADEFAYLTDAVPSTLSTLLGEMDAFEMKMPPTSLEFEMVKGDLKRIADAYGVNTLLISSVTSQQDHLIIDVQIVEAQGRSVLWSKQFEGSRSNYIDLTRRAADAIRGTIRPESPALTARAESASHSEAELAFRQGKYYSNLYNNRHQEGDFKIALAAFERALELEPTMADAAAEIAMLYVFRIEATDTSAEALTEQVGDWGRRALSINRGCGLAWTALVAQSYYQPHADRQQLFEHGIKAAFFGPKNGMNYVSLWVGLRASVTLQLAAIQEARRLDPLYLQSQVNAAEALRRSGRFDEALNIVDYVLSVEPDMPYAFAEKGLDLVFLHRMKEADHYIELVNENVQTGRFPSAKALYLNLALALGRNNKNDASKYLDETLKIVFNPETSQFDLANAYSICTPLLIRHRHKEAAMKILVRCVEAGVVPEYDWLLLNRDLASLRGDARFQEIVVSARKQFDEMLGMLNEARSRGEFPKFLEKPLADHLNELGMQ